MFVLHPTYIKTEFSSEGLLSFVEIAQYKFALKMRADRIDRELIERQEAFDKQVPLSGACPMSAINKNGFSAISAYKQDDESKQLLTEQTKEVCIEIYKKYVAGL